MRRTIVTVMGVCVLIVGTAVPVAASPPEEATEAHHLTRHRVGAQFNNEFRRHSVAITATWYSPKSSSGDNWFIPESNLYVTYYGDKIGDDCTIPSTRIDDWDMKWSQNHGYVAFDSECGFFELFVQGVGGVEPDHEWSHNNEYWNGEHHVRSSQWNSAGTRADLYLDGKLLNVVPNGAALTRTSSLIVR